MEFYEQVGKDKRVYGISVLQYTMGEMSATTV